MVPYEGFMKQKYSFWQKRLQQNFRPDNYVYILSQEHFQNYYKLYNCQYNMLIH